jgi:hypothetical protein
MSSNRMRPAPRWCLAPAERAGVPAPDARLLAIGATASLRRANVSYSSIRRRRRAGCSCAGLVRTGSPPRRPAEAGDAGAK